MQQSNFGANLDMISLVNKADFPGNLIDSIGEENFNNMKELTVEDKGTGYFNNSFSWDTLNNGPIKAKDQSERPCIAMGLTRLTDQARLIFITFQRYAPQTQNTLFYFASFIQLLNADSFSPCDSGIMSPQQYDMIQSIFNNTHPTLTLCTAKENPPERSLI